LPTLLIVLLSTENHAQFWFHAQEFLSLEISRQDHFTLQNRLHSTVIGMKHSLQADLYDKAQHPVQNSIIIEDESQHLADWNQNNEN